MAHVSSSSSSSFSSSSSTSSSSHRWFLLWKDVRLSNAVLSHGRAGPFVFLSIAIFSLSLSSRGPRTAKLTKWPRDFLDSRANEVSRCTRPAQCPFRDLSRLKGSIRKFYEWNSSFSSATWDLWRVSPPLRFCSSTFKWPLGKFIRVDKELQCHHPTSDPINNV